MVDAVGNAINYLASGELSSSGVASAKAQIQDAKLATNASAKVMDSSKTQGENILNLLQNVFDVKA